GGPSLVDRRKRRPVINAIPVPAKAAFGRIPAILGEAAATCRAVRRVPASLDASTELLRRPRLRARRAAPPRTGLDPRAREPRRQLVRPGVAGAEPRDRGPGRGTARRDPGGRSRRGGARRAGRF